MTTDSTPTPLEIVGRLAEAVSLQAKLTNRMWIATITASFVALFPRVETIDGQSVAALPFALGQVPTSTFFPLTYFVLAIIVLALASAHAQQLRASTLSQAVIDSLPKSLSGSSHALHGRYLFDILRVPSLTRVAPIAQLIRGDNRVAEEEQQSSTLRRGVSTLLYVLLKLVTLAVFFILPGGTLVYSYRRSSESGLAGPFLFASQAAGILALLGLLIVTLGDIWYGFGAARRLWTRGAMHHRGGNAT